MVSNRTIIAEVLKQIDVDSIQGLPNYNIMFPGFTSKPFPSAN